MDWVQMNPHAAPSGDTTADPTICDVIVFCCAHAMLFYDYIIVM